MLVYKYFYKEIQLSINSYRIYRPKLLKDVQYKVTGHDYIRSLADTKFIQFDAGTTMRSDVMFIPTLRIVLVVLLRFCPCVTFKYTWTVLSFLFCSLQPHNMGRFIVSMVLFPHVSRRSKNHPVKAVITRESPTLEKITENAS